MKMAVVEPVGKGGLAHYAFQLCRAMQSLGAEVTLVTSRDFELAGLERELAVEAVLRRWDPKPDTSASPGRWRRLRRLGRAAVHYREWARAVAVVRRLRPDVVQLGDLRFAGDLLPVRAMRAVAPVLTDVCHNVRPFSSGGSFDMSGLGAAAYRRAYRQFDAVFVHYEVNRAAFAATFPESAARAVPIVMGNQGLFAELADPEATPARLAAELELPEGSRVALLFGTLSSYKGLDLLLDALPRLVERVPEAVVVAAGYPLPDFNPDAFAAEAARRGVAAHLRLVARWIPSEQVRAWMELADVAVFPYRDLFQSAVVHIAQTFGVPMVATGVGAMAEVVRHGETGLLVPPGDPAALAEALALLLGNPPLAAQLGRAAAADARGRFSWESVAATVLATCEAALAGRRE